MTDEQTTGTVTHAKGTAEATAGKLTGNKEQEAHGQATQVKGDAQKVLGDVQDVVRGPKG